MRGRGRGYGQFCPVAMAAEIVAERWTPLILREFMFGSHRFSELRRGIPLISQSLLTQRLRSLEHDGVIEQRPTTDGRGQEYHLTRAGEELRPIIELLGAWGHRWTGDRLREDDWDPAVLMWFLYRLVQVAALPERRVVVQFELRQGRYRLWWLILDRPEVDLCLRDEGFEVDLYVTADTRVLAEAILGRRELRQAIQSGLVTVDGPRDLARAFPDWIGVSGFGQIPVPISMAAVGH
ncbi:MAG: winged helix-turn-helix transcriptional regulator [Chloroflexota bacterium]